MADPAAIVPGNNERPPALLRSVMGEALRRIRLQQGRTLADVARAARISMPYLSEIERGLKEPSSEILAAVCEALGIELPELLVVVLRELAGERVMVSTLRAASTTRAAMPGRTAGGSAGTVMTLAA
ncbi:helix-turn-helix transcriptional regulator [Spongiactinospora sp. TRM90649]|uniref:helix-turn-helix domain-containing protein n=1 Tax=Spongiactinospora sp. TRM90649 TaxID=3031114 RepID=UPI0023F8AF59|nr:helix-turn-helix transcriptional regulator [Spongiactinospora sp. TRM90649]MDF5754239.1 helix-turn-helix transcriptional regulator [Spongiactinospora sp. TRM90649]